MSVVCCVLASHTEYHIVTGKVVDVHLFYKHSRSINTLYSKKLLKHIGKCNAVSCITVIHPELLFSFILFITHAYRNVYVNNT